jgi:hypothetical protein
VRGIEVSWNLLSASCTNVFLTNSVLLSDATHATGPRLAEEDEEGKEEEGERRPSKASIKGTIAASS